MATRAFRCHLSGRGDRWLSVAAMLLIMCLSGVIAFFMIDGARHEAEARGQAERTAAVIGALTAALDAALQAETGQRGFLLTGRTAYLGPFTEGAAAWLLHLDHAAALLGDSSANDSGNGSGSDGGDHRIALSRLRTLAEAKLDELGRTIEAAEAGNRGAALAIVNSDQGKALMTEYRGATSRLIAEERADLVAAIDRAASAEARDLPLMLTLLGVGVLLSGAIVLLERRVRQARLLAAAQEREILLTRELNHRIKNVFAVIGSMIGLAGRSGEDTAATLAGLRERVRALSIAHSLTGAVSSQPVGLDMVVDATLSPYRDDGERITTRGGPVDLPANAVTPLGLILHELATNAVKYGALAREDGRLAVEWSQERSGGDGSLRLVWRESSAINGFREPDREGFGTMMMSMSAQQLDGRIQRRFTGDGLETVLEIPLDGPRR